MVEQFRGAVLDRGVTLSSAEAEFVAASQESQEAVYLRALLRGFNFDKSAPQKYGKIMPLVL